MPPLLTLLLSAPPPALPAWLPGVAVALFGVLVTLYLNRRKEEREDGQTPTQRLHKLEVEHAKFEKRQQGFQLEIEGVADNAARERTTLADSHKRDFDTLKEQIKDVPNMRDLLNRMDERFISTTTAVNKLDAKMDQIVALLTHK